MTLDTKELENLTTKVAQLCGTYNNENNVGMAKDWAWAELTMDVLPKLQKFLENIKN
jgi:hypothetical protein